VIASAQLDLGIALRPSSSLVDRVLGLLEAGPLHTGRIAETVLCVRGEAPAAAMAVFTLLGSDPRFHVDASGFWSLAAPPPPGAARALLDEDWAVVDVETTGGAPERGHRITEVAAVCVSGGRVVERYSTLVNPERRIPTMITALTGITESMVSNAPPFRAVAQRLAAVLEGRVFVAHNAGFDWRFVGCEIDRATGATMSGRRLCTVRLARKLLPQLPSRSLGALAHYFGIRIERHHRALDDAAATAELLVRMLEMLAERDVMDWEAMQGFLRKRAPRRKRRATPRSVESA
jgi:DNA polymerase III subunit epsilon